MKDDSLRPVQIMTLTASAIFGVDILLVPQRMARIAGQDGWISLGLGGLLSLASASLIYYLVSLYPEDDMPNICIKVLGRLLGRIIMLPTLLYTFIYVALSFRIFAQALLTFLLDRTPIYAIVLLMLLVTAYAVYKGIYTMASVCDLLFPLALITLIVLVATTISQGRLDYLRPILFDNSDKVLKGVLPGLQEYTGYSIIAYIYSHSQKGARTYKWYMVGILIPIIFYILITLVCIMNFTAPGLEGVLYPTLTLSKSIEYTPLFMERLEAFVAVIWISIVFASGMAYYYAASRNIAVFFGVKSQYERYIVFAFIPLLLILAILEPNVLKSIKQITYLKTTQILVAGFVFPLLIVITLIKRRSSIKK